MFFRVPVTENSYNEVQRGYFPGGHRKIERKSNGVFHFLAGIFSVNKVFFDVSVTELYFEISEVSNVFGSCSNKTKLHFQCPVLLVGTANNLGR